jgi:hypothetical protein
MSEMEMAPLGFRVEKEVLEELKDICKKEHIQLSTLARRWLLRSMESYKKNGKL